MLAPCTRSERKKGKGRQGVNVRQAYCHWHPLPLTVMAGGAGTFNASKFSPPNSSPQLWDVNVHKVFPSTVKALFFACLRNSLEPMKQHCGVCFLCTLIESLPVAEVLPQVKEFWPLVLAGESGCASVVEKIRERWGRVRQKKKGGE